MGLQATPRGGSGERTPMYVDVMRRTYAEMGSGRKLESRNQMWWHGRMASPDSPDSIERTFARNFAANMIRRLRDVGETNYNDFSSKLERFPHELCKGVASALIPGHITHGVCRFAHKVEDVSRETVDVVRFYVTNGDVEIDPDRGNAYLRLLDNTRERVMYYGLAQTLDRNGAFLSLNREMGDDGVMFLTDDRREALFNVAGIATGRPAELFRKMAEPAVAVASPKF